MKFGRSYWLSATGLGGREVTASFPLTLDLATAHSVNAESNVGDFSLYNLGAGQRAVLAINQFSKVQPYPITVRAGYISQNQLGLSGSPLSLPIIFDGFIRVAYTEKAGSDLITRINALDDADLCNSDGSAVFPANYSIPAGTPFNVMVSQIMSLLKPLIQPGNVTISPMPPAVSSRGSRPFSGRVWNALVELANEVHGTQVYIQHGVVYMITQNNTTGPNNLGTLQSSTGLLGIPKIVVPNILCSCVFEPSITVGALINLKSKYTPTINGPCKIVGYNHVGRISGVESGNLITELTLQSIDAPLSD